LAKYIVLPMGEVFMGTKESYFISSDIHSDLNIAETRQFQGHWYY